MCVCANKIYRKSDKSCHKLYNVEKIAAASGSKYKKTPHKETGKKQKSPM